MTAIQFGNGVIFAKPVEGNVIKKKKRKKKFKAHTLDLFDGAIGILSHKPVNIESVKYSKNEIRFEVE